MKISQAAILALASAVVDAHYTFPSLTVNGQVVGGGDWVNVRKTKNWQNNGPVTDVTSRDIRCNELNPGTGATTLNVTAGATVGFAANPDTYHPGPAQLYLAKVPAGQTAATFSGDGNVWFKIYGEQPNFGTKELAWPSQDAKQINTALPRCLPSGEYVYRIEHIALHAASSPGGAQFYISCGQLSISGGGSADPAPKVAFPGAYSASDPGIQINIYYPVPTSYKNPGPPVFKC